MCRTIIWKKLSQGDIPQSYFFLQRNYPTVLSNYIRNLQQNYVLYRERANNNDYFVRQTILRWLVMFITLDCIKINNFQLIAIS